ncbi:endonuclease/reverse transcriptase [Ceratobasidium theobromae]|uniref:Endonuclease/reverse transcriptase n=1 Tax=Ceratobasidium theobromae TaxID=1582974 RepID=A0A5N5Q8U3_9AGAM|nr:endonuclease/reverse transcriptase [Ceratobasidium theobromae]
MSMSTISNSQPPAPPDKIPPDIDMAKIEDHQSAPADSVVVPSGPERVTSCFPPRMVPYKLESSPGLWRSSRLAASGRIASGKLPAASPNLKAASDEYLEEKHKEFMSMNRELKEKKRKKGLQVEARGSPLIPVPRSRNPSRDPSPSPLKVDQTLFTDERLYAKNIDITNEIPPADQQVSLAPADPITENLAPPAPLPGTDRPTPAPPSPLPIEANDLMLTKKVADSILDIATKDMLDRLTAPMVHDPPGDEKLALPQILGGPWDRLKTAMRRRAACPYAKAGASALTPVELRLWGDLLKQVSGFASEVSGFLESFDHSPRGDPKENTAVTEAPPPNQFSWSGDDVALAMQSAVFAVTGEFISWERALQRAKDFDAAHTAHNTPPEENALGLFVQPPPTVKTPAGPASPRVRHIGGVPSKIPVTAATPALTAQIPAQTWANVAAPKATKPTPAKSTNPPIRNTTAILKELNQIKAQKALPTDTTTIEQGEEGWNVQGKGKKTKAVATPAAALPTGVIPVRRGRARRDESGNMADLEVAFKPESPIDSDLVKARANPNESRSCLMRLLKHCNELTSSKEYKDKTDIRVKSFTYSRNGNCIAVFTPKTSIREVELFAPGLCGVMGLRGAVTVQRTSGWTRMRVSHFPAWATDPDTGEWLDRINTKEEILSVLRDFAPRKLLTRFPPVDVRFFKPDAVVGQCRPGGFETIVISVDDPTGEAQAAYSRAGLSFGYRNSFISPHTTRPKIAECKRCCSYQCARPQACSAPMRCYKCGECHDPKNHDSRCSQCRAQKLADRPGHVCTCAPRCANCKGAHVFGDPLCPGRLKYAAVPVVAFADEYAPIDVRNINPPGGTPWSQASRRTPPTGLISPKAPQPPALAENGLISQEIMQVNAVKSNTRIHALLASPEYNDISILIISDPWWGPIGTAKHDTNDQFRLLGAPANPMWRCFAPPIDTQNPNSPPSCIVYVRKDRGIVAEIDPLAPATPFFFTLDVFTNGFSFKIIPVYLHGPKHMEAASALFQFPMIEVPTLVCGDFNIQHPEFVDFPGAKVKTSALGREFADWLLDNDLHVLNDLHRPTREPRVRGHAPSIIDFTIANGVLFSMDIVSDWDSSFAHSLDSDHAALFFTIHAPRISEQPIRHSRFVIDPLMEDDWTAAFEHRVLELGLKSSVACSQEVEELASGLLSACTWATEAVMESRPTQRKAPHAPWWNEDCSAACGRVVTAKEEGMDREEIRTRTSHLWYCIRKAKRAFFDEICSTARPDNIWGINQWYRGRKSYGLPTLRGPDGTLTTTNSAKAELLHDTFFPFTPATPAGLSLQQ